MEDFMSDNDGGREKIEKQHFASEAEIEEVNREAEERQREASEAEIQQVEAETND